MSKDIEDLKEMQSYFQKCVDILEEAIKLSKQLEIEKDEEKIKALNNKSEELAGRFLMQMLKISSLK